VASGTASGVASTAPSGAARAEPTPRTNALGWLADDPEAAFARARRENKLVVVDLWAPWCHTCSSMKEFVLTGAKLPGVASRFVFLAIDTELERNADFLRRFPTSGWPTFYVLEPAGPSVRGRWLGAASPGQFARFLADAEQAEALAGEAPSTDEPSTLLAAAGELAAERRYAEAAQKYRAALEHEPRDWPRAPDVRVALASALLKSGAAGACVDLALGAPPIDTRSPISAADFAASTLDCAERLPDSDARRRRARERAAADLGPLCERGDFELTPDDRGDACESLMEARKALGDAPGARRAAETCLGVLEDAARGMPDEVAVIYDPAQSEMLLALGRGEEALRLLEARETALPDNYNPPYYLARAALRLERWELGLNAADRALARAYGPRRANIYGLRADLLLGAGRKPEAIVALKSQIATLALLPEGQKRPDAERSARERLEKLEAMR
jgi:thioredoxin-like negative regulator of GroEL